MKGLWSFCRSFGIVAGLVGLVASSGCNTQTPASFDPIEIALVRVEPGNGESSVPRNRAVRMIFNTDVLPESVTDQSIIIRTGGNFNIRPTGTFLISGNIVEFDPTVTSAGGANAIGFEAGVQVLVEIPLKVAGDGEPKNNFVQNVETNPITLASGANIITFTTGAGWDDPVPGPPGVLGLDFTPGPDAVGQVPSSAAVTVVFSEPVDPGSIVLGKNIFLTNNTVTAPIYQQDLPSITFYDGSLTRYTFQPVFGFGQGPFNILVNFIDPDAPDTFDPPGLPTDLAGNRVQNFTFYATFDTQFDPTTVNTGLVRETFQDQGQLDGMNTDAIWGDDPDFPFALVSQPITTRVQNANIIAFTSISQLTSFIDNPPTGIGEEDYCPTANILVGPDLAITSPPPSQGRRLQDLYRQGELGARGTVTRAAWGPDSDATFAATYSGVIVRLGHKAKNTSFAQSGLFANFDVNGFVTVVNKVTYTVPQAADINGAPINDGYLDWPKFETFFEYDGQNDLVIDMEAEEGNTFQTFRTYITVSYLGFGTCSCFSFAGCTPNNSGGLRQANSTYNSDFLNPAPIPLTVVNPAPFIDVMQFELAKLRSDAQSLYYDTKSLDPDYLAPIINPLVQNGGATIQVTWSASADGIVEDVPFTPNIDDCDHYQYLRFHFILRSNIFTSARARVELVEVPFIFP